MARKIKVDCLVNIFSEEDGGIVRKGNVAHLTGKEFKHYDKRGAVKRVEDYEEEAEEVEAEVEKSIEGGDA